MSEQKREELIKKLKKQKQFILIQSFVLILMMILSIVSTVDNGITFLTFLPLFFIPMLIVMVYELNRPNLIF